MVNKKNLLILLSIPLFCLYYRLMAVYGDTPYSLSDMLCFGAFVICAALVMAFQAKSIKIAGLSAVHAGLVAALIFFPEETGFTLQRFYIYCLFCLPPLFLLAMLYWRKEVPGAAQEPEQATAASAKMLMIFEFVQLNLLLPLLIAFFIGKEKIYFKFETVARYIALVFVLAVFGYVVLHFAGAFERTDARQSTFALCLSSFCCCLVYTIWASQYVYDPIYMIFPLCVPLVICYKRYKVFGNLRGLVKKKKSSGESE